MNKRKILLLLLFVLPLLVVLVANSPKAVMVFDGETVTYYPWMQPVSDTAMGWCAPVAIVLNYAVFGLTVFYSLKKKEWCVKGIRNLAAVAGFLAVLPNLIRSDVMVIPNVLGGIALFANAIVAHILLKDLATGQKKSALKEPKHL